MSPAQRHSGFSLLEAIVALVLAGFLAVGILAYFDQVLTRADVPFTRMQNATQLSNAMEAVSRDYEALSTKNAADLTSFSAKVNNFSANYGTYCATCTGRAATASVGALNDAVLVTLTNSAGEKIFHLYTVQSY